MIDDIKLCVSLSRFTGLGHGLAVPVLGGDLGYAFPPTPIIPQVLNENYLILLIAPARPGAISQVVSTSQDPPQTTPVRDLSSSAGVPGTSCMALIQSAMQAKGFSERSARSVRVSTRSVYDAKWKIFVDWCGKQKFDPLRTTVPQLAQFWN